MPSIKEILKMRALFSTVKKLEGQVSALEVKDVEYATSISELSAKLDTMQTEINTLKAE